MENDGSSRKPSTARSPRTAPPSRSPRPSAESRRRRRSWDRLLRKIYDVDPLRWGCGGSLRLIAVIDQPHVIRRILAHLKQGQGLQRAPPPRLFPQKQQHFLAELSPQRAQAVRASDDSRRLLRRSSTLFWDEVPDWPH